MKKVPFYFYIDTSAVDVSKKSQKNLLDDYKNWMSRVSSNNNLLCTEPNKYAYDTEYLGFIEQPPKDKHLGAFYSSIESEFTSQKSRKVSLDYWKKNIKNKKYEVLSVECDSWGDYKCDNQGNLLYKVVKVHRYDVCRMKTRASSITKGLKRLNIDPKKFQGVHSKKYLIYAGKLKITNYGLLLTGEPTSNVQNNSYPDFEIKNLVKRGEIIQCPVTSGYVLAGEVNVIEMINESGEVLSVPTYYVSGVRSILHHKIFVNDQSAENYGYVKCPASYDWVLPSEVKEIPNAGYHKLERKFMCRKDVYFTIGFEIEKEDRDAMENIGYKKLFNRTSWCKERDGSLGSYGYELVSPVYDLFSNKMDLDIKGDSDLIKLIDGTFSNNCGGHINIGSKVYSPIQLLYGINGFLPLLYAIWSVRVSNSYSRVMKTHQYDSSKNAIKVKNNVIEIRLATAVKSVKNMMWRRDLIRIMMKNINKSEAEVLRMMLNPRSILHRHLRKVYNSERFMSKCNMFVKYSEQFNNIKLDNPDWDALDAAKAESSPQIEED